MPAGETGGVWSGVAVWPAICAGIATIDCSINATKIRLTNGSLSSVVIVNFAMSIIEFARGVWSCFLTHLPRTFVPVVAGIGLSSAGWKQRWHRTLSQERSDACHHCGRQVMSTRTGMSLLTGTAKSDGGSILKSDSVAGIVPEIRIWFP